MSPGTRRIFALAATLALAGSAFAVPVVAQDTRQHRRPDVRVEVRARAGHAGWFGRHRRLADPRSAQPTTSRTPSSTRRSFRGVRTSLWDVSSDFKYIPELAVSIPTIANGGVRIDAEPTAECANRREGYEDLPGFEVDLNIRPGLKWSDGETLDLNDSSTPGDWILDPDNVGLYAGTDGWDIIDRFEVSEDGLTATLHFCTGFTGYYGLSRQPILPEHYMSTIPVADAAHAVLPGRARPRERARPPAPSSSRAPARAPSSSCATRTG